MSDYTPTTNEVRADYVRDHTRGYDEYQGDQTLTAMQEHYGAEFDAWLAQHDAEVRSAALDADERDRLAAIIRYLDVAHPVLDPAALAEAILERLAR